MKKIKLFGVLVLLIFALTSCGNIFETEQGDVIKGLCEDFIDCVISGDSEKAFTFITKGANKESFNTNFEKIKEHISGVETFTLSQKGWYSGYNQGTKYYEATFLMETNTVEYVVTGTMVNGHDGLYQFNIIEKSKSNAVYTGTLTTLDGATPTQWGVIAFSGVCLVFVVLMIIDCAKRKVKKKALWIILILLFGMGLSFEVGEGLRLKFNVLYVGYSYLKIFGTGDVVFQLAFPVGAILYLIFRKKITIKEPIKCDFSDESTAEETLNDNIESPDDSQNGGENVDNVGGQD